MENNEITEETREHYEDLISEVGEQYFNKRWMSNPVARSHYHQTVKAINHILVRCPQDLDVLEVGSGPGTWTNVLLEVSRTLKVFDISSEFLKVMKHKYQSESRVRDFICGDFVEDSARLNGEQFDMIFSGRALEYMSSKQQVVENCYDHLKDNGYLVIITKNPMWRDKRLSKKDNEGIHRAQIYWKDLSSMFYEQGFEDVKVLPAAMGSYHFPLNNRAGACISDLVFKFTFKKPMNESIDALTESYLIIGRKAVNTKNVVKL